MFDVNKAYLRSDGCTVFNNCVTIDGFLPGAPVRIQSHAHKDHLKDFERSKGAQETIILTRPTYDLLNAEYNGDLPYRKRQFRVLPADGSGYEVIDGVKVALYSSSHLLGSAIAEVHCDGYGTFVSAADFSWPIVRLPTRPDVLVVDATYGDPAGIRNYDQEEVEEKFLRLVAEKWTQGSVFVRGHRGRLEQSMRMLRELVDGPFLYSEPVSRTLPVFENYFGFDTRGFVFGSTEFREILQKGDRFVAFCYPFETRFVEQLHPRTRILLSAYMVPEQEPIKEHDAGLTRVALTDHADFCETIELITRIAPKFVIADGTRGGNPDALARFVLEELQIDAVAKTVPTTLRWGQH